MFASPEEYITEQGEKDFSMFFIIQGECFVAIEDYSNNQVHIKDSILVRSDHFGEIGCIYNCTRTASIICSKYNILARLIRPRLRALTSDYPELADKWKKHIWRQQDPYKDFMFNIFRHIPYFSNLKANLFHKVIYSFKELICEKD